MCPSLSVSQATAKCKDEDIDDYGAVIRSLVPRSQCCSYSADARRNRLERRVNTN